MGTRKRHHQPFALPEAIRYSTTHLANRAREVDALRRVVVRVVRGSDLVRRDALLDPAHDRVEDVVLRVVREGGVRIARCSEGGRSGAALLRCGVKLRVQANADQRQGRMHTPL